MPITIKKGFLSLILSVLMLFCLATFTGCGGGDDGSDSTDSSISDNSSGDTEDDSSDDTSDDSSNDTSDDSSETTVITLNGDSITVNGEGVTVSGTIAAVTSPGTYGIIGTLNDGQIIVDTEAGSAVDLVLNGVNINCSNSSPIYIMTATGTNTITLSEDTENYITDGDSYTSLDEDGEPDAAIFSKSDMVITGDGSLTLDANYKDGIKCKDGLTIESGNIEINSADDGIIGKDYIEIEAGSITIDAEGDGLKSTEDDDTALGYIDVTGGFFDISSGADAIQAETDIFIADGDFVLTTAGGSSTTLAEDETAKGIKASVNITINSGDFTIDSADDSIHSNDAIEINGGIFSISSGDDAIHADSEIEINGGEIDILEAYEGIEGLTITINDGEIHVDSEDDPINATDGNGDTNKVGYLYINGGYIAVDCANADGLDSNGIIVMTDGLVIVNGPVSGGNGILDYDKFTMNGGTIIGAGTSDMEQAPGSDTSAQYALLFKFSQQQTAGALFHIETGGGEEIITFAPAKAYASIVFSSPDLESGTAYKVYKNGSYDGGTETDGLHEGGTYNEGTLIDTFTISSKVTTRNI